MSFSPFTKKHRFYDDLVGLLEEQGILESADAYSAETPTINVYAPVDIFGEIKKTAFARDTFDHYLRFQLQRIEPSDNGYVKPLDISENHVFEKVLVIYNSTPCNEQARFQLDDVLNAGTGDLVKITKNIPEKITVDKGLLSDKYEGTREICFTTRELTDYTDLMHHLEEAAKYKARDFGDSSGPGQVPMIYLGKDMSAKIRTPQGIELFEWDGAILKGYSLD